MSLLLIKFRQQFGIQRFTRVFLIGFLALTVTQLFVHSYRTELIVRGASGIVASGLSTLALFYIMQAMPTAARLGGMILGVGVSQVATPLARVISPVLLVHRSEEHTSELQSLMRISYAVFCLKKK